MLLYSLKKYSETIESGPSAASRIGVNRRRESRVAPGSRICAFRNNYKDIAPGKVTGRRRMLLYSLEKLSETRKLTYADDSSWLGMTAHATVSI